MDLRGKKRMPPTVDFMEPRRGGEGLETTLKRDRDMHDNMSSSMRGDVRGQVCDTRALCDTKKLHKVLRF